MIQNRDSFLDLKRSISKEMKVISEIAQFKEDLRKIKDEKEKREVNSHINSLKRVLNRESGNVFRIVNQLSLVKSLPNQKIPEIAKKSEVNPSKMSKKTKEVYGITDLEMEVVKRLGEKKVTKKKKVKKSSLEYLRTSNKFFSNLSRPLVDALFFRTMKQDLVKSNIKFSPRGYISMIFLTVAISFVVSIFVMIFFLFFNITAILPIIVFAGEAFLPRIIKIFWIPLAAPIITFLIMFFYPSLERGSIERKIDSELPFATIHMSAISGSLVEPSKIFSILISTKEYPNLEKEFIKLINEINIYGYDLVTALKSSALRSPSRKLSELYNGLATTITSGGDLANFFEKRSQTLLLDYRLEREKETKANETFMDIYISVVIAAPMILMLLLMMMQISGLGVSLSTGLITLIMVLAVGAINVVFLTFLHLKKPSE